MSCVTIAGLPTLVPRVFNLQEDELWEKKHPRNEVLGTIPGRTLQVLNCAQALHDAK